MSDLLSRKLLADLQRASLPEAPSKPAVSDWHLLWGVLLPAATLAIELGWHLCAEAFFDPVPTAWHAALVATVPAANLFVWYRLRQDEADNSRLLAMVSGISLSVSAFYALLFLPLVPIAAIAVIFYGLGLLPLSPLLAFISALKLRAAARAHHPSSAFSRPLAAGLATGFVLLLALDIPAAATRIGIQMAASSNPDQRESGVTLLRNLGDTGLLLRLCYDTTGRPSGLLSWLAVLGGSAVFNGAERQVAQTTEEVREIYYRVTGEPFNAQPAPYTKGSWARFNDLDFDADLGGTSVGGRVKGLTLVSSRLDGSIAADDAVAYLEWILEFRNTSFAPQEARLELALPPGAVVSRATLWVNGEEREAAYGSREQARAAYQEVAVVRRRDPLLVTTKGADRALAQAFPVPAGGTIKFKIGMTAPLEITSLASARLALPAIADRNFSFPPETPHSVWIEATSPVKTEAPGLTASTIGPNHFRIAGAIPDRDLSGLRQTIAVSRDPSAGAVETTLGDGHAVRQEIVARETAAPPAMMIVIDGSARMAPHIPQILKALDSLPETARAGLILAQNRVGRIALTPWTDAAKRQAARLLEKAEFTGGEDNTAALAEALTALEKEPGGTLLWIHAPQPVAFRGSGAQLDQATARLARLPNVVLYSVTPGPNVLLPDAAWAWSARSLPQTGNVLADLARYLERTYAATASFEIVRSKGDPTPGAVKGSEHIAKLWAAEEILSLMRTAPAASRAEATALAAAHRLVTPVSGAVVLETQQQFTEAGLSPVAQGTVPTVPEPHEWALLIIAGLALLWLARQRQTSGGAAA